MVTARSFLYLSNVVVVQGRAFPSGLVDAGMHPSRIAMALVEVEEEDDMEGFLMSASKLNKLALSQMSDW